MAKTFDGPPTLERSGSEHRVGRFPSSSLRGEDRGGRKSFPWRWAGGDVQDGVCKVLKVDM